VRVLAIDPGDARTGLALADAVTRIATPIGVIEAPISERDGGALIDALARAAREHAPGSDDTLAMGYPINMDGRIGERAQLVRSIGLRLARALGRRVVLVDERCTSARADERMARTGLTHKQKKSRRDAIAAAEIAESYLADPGSVIETLDPRVSTPRSEQSRRPDRCSRNRNEGNAERGHNDA